MKKLLISVVGPTATGKTQLALDLAQQFCQESGRSAYLISADSRQVYQELPILTGADVPASFQPQTSPDFKYPFYQHQNLAISLHGIGIISADQDWSVGHFQDFAQAIIKKAWQEEALVILVGGTGLYHLHLFNQDPQFRVLPNLQIREKTENMTVSQLQTWLNKLNPKQLKQMNNSDVNNPRRLVRAIETNLALKNEVLPPKTENLNQQNFTPIVFYLNLDLDIIKEKIEQRVIERWKNGVITEVNNLPAINKHCPLATTTGLKEIQLYLKQQIDKQSCQNSWIQAEISYAKRQITWWKKRSNLIKLEVGQQNIKKKAWGIIKKHL